MFNPSKIIGLKRVGTDAKAELWEIQLPKRTFRYVWIFGGWFPSYLFDNDFIRNSLTKTYREAIVERVIANRKSSNARLEAEQRRLDKELDRQNTPTGEVK